MSCDNSLKAFCARAAADPQVAAALGGRDAAAVLEELVDLGRARARQELAGRPKTLGAREKLADLTATAQCSAVFARMAERGITPPAHGRPRAGMPFPLPADKDAIYGYAALETALAAAHEGRPLPDLARDVLAGAVARRSVAANAAPARAVDWGAAARSRVSAQPYLVDAANDDPRATHQIGMLAGVAETLAAAPDTPDTVRAAALRVLASLRGGALGDDDGYQALGAAICAAAGVQQCPRCGQFQAAAGDHQCPVRDALRLVPALAANAHGAGPELSGRDRTLLRPFAGAIAHSPGAGGALVFAARAWLEAERSAGLLSRPWSSAATAQLALALGDADRGEGHFPGPPRAVAAAALAAAPAIRDIASADMLFDPDDEIRARLALSAPRRRFSTTRA